VLNIVGNRNTTVGIVILSSLGTTDVYAVRRWPRRRCAAHTCIRIHVEIVCISIAGRVNGPL